MSAGLPRVLTVVAAVGAGLSAGVFLAFSTFVMRALGRLPAAQGLSAMQAINRAAPTPLFMLALFGTAVVCVVLAVWAVTDLSEPVAVYVLIGSAVFLAGIVLTIAYHVPRNDALALVDPNGSGATDTWERYRGAWTAWNHVRTLTCLGGSVAFTIALRVG
jgi:uncharacterized membrane protein